MSNLKSYDVEVRLIYSAVADSAQEAEDIAIDEVDTLLPNTNAKVIGVTEI